MKKNSRREFLRRLTPAAIAAPLLPAAVAAAENEKPRPKRAHRVTLAQLKVTREVSANFSRMKPAFQQAARENAQWILFPEGMLSGYTGEFDQDEVANAFSKCASLCARHNLTALIGTCWKRDGGKIFNQIRMVGPDGRAFGSYAKRCLT